MIAEVSSGVAITVAGIQPPVALDDIEARIRQMLLNMERRRWMPDDPGESEEA